jgi:hypothetical protein
VSTKHNEKTIQFLADGWKWEAKNHINDKRNIKKKGRIEIQPVFNPISYEKPIYQTKTEN